MVVLAKDNSMATTRTYLDYLDEKIDISPANSQEELDAAELIGSLMEEHGLDVQMQEFDAPAQGGLAHDVLYIVMFVGILLAGFFSSAVGILGLVLVMVSFVFMVLAYAGHDVLANLGPRGRSQNVIGVHRASGPLVMKGNRPIVIVAHYDSPNEDLLSHPSVSAYQPMIKRSTFVCSVVVPLCALFQLLVFLPAGFRHIFWIVGILASLPLLAVGVSAIYQRFAPCTTGASDNKSSLAAMLGVMDMVAPHDDAAKRYVALHPRRQEQAAYDQVAPEDADQYYGAAAAEGQQPGGAMPRPEGADYAEGQFFSPEQGEFEPAAPADQPYVGQDQAAPAEAANAQGGEKDEAPYPEAPYAQQPQTVPVDETVVREPAVPAKRDEAAATEPPADAGLASKTAGLAGFFRKAADSVSERVQGFRKGNAAPAGAGRSEGTDASANPTAFESDRGEDGLAGAAAQQPAANGNIYVQGEASANRGDVTGAHDVRTRSGQRLEDIVPEVGDNPFDGNVRRGPDFVGSLNILPTDCEIVYDNPPRPKPDLTKLPQIPDIPDFEKEYEEKYARLYEQESAEESQTEQEYEPSGATDSDGSQPEDVVYEPYDPTATNESNANPYMAQNQPTVDYIHYVTYDEQYPIVEEYEVLEEPTPAAEPKAERHAARHDAAAEQVEDASVEEPPAEGAPTEPAPTAPATTEPVHPDDAARVDASERATRLVDLPEIAPSQDEPRDVSVAEPKQDTDAQDAGSVEEDYYVPVDAEPVAPYYDDEEAAPTPQEPEDAASDDAVSEGATDEESAGEAYAPAESLPEDDATVASEEAWETIATQPASEYASAAEPEQTDARGQGLFASLQAKLASAFGKKKGDRHEDTSFSPAGSDEAQNLDSTMDMPVLNMNEYEPTSSWDVEPTESAPAVGDDDQPQTADQSDATLEPDYGQPITPVEDDGAEDDGSVEPVEQPRASQDVMQDAAQYAEAELEVEDNSVATADEIPAEQPEEAPAPEPAQDVEFEPEPAPEPEPEPETEDEAEPEPESEPEPDATFEPAPAPEPPMAMEYEQAPEEAAPAEPAPLQEAAPSAAPERARLPKYSYFVDDTPIVEDYEVIDDSGEKNEPPMQDDGGQGAADEPADATTKLDAYESSTYDQLESTAHLRPLKPTATLREEYPDKVEPMPVTGEEQLPIEPMYEDEPTAAAQGEQLEADVEPEPESEPAPTIEPEPEPEPEPEQDVAPADEEASDAAEEPADAVANQAVDMQEQPEAVAPEDPDATDPAVEALSHLNFAPNEEVPESELEAKDASGLDAPIEDTGSAAQKKVPEPRPVDDPNWGRSEYRPQTNSVARRAVLFDLPDPSESSSDPFASGPLDGVKKAANAGRTPVGAGAERADSGPVGTREPIGLVKGAQPMRNEAMRFSVDRNRKKAPTHHKVKLPNLFGGRPKRLDPSEGQQSMSEWLGVEEDYDAKKDGRKIGDWDHFNSSDNDEGEKSGRKGTWKGGATTRSGFRVVDGDAPDGAYAGQGDVPADAPYADDPYAQQPQQGDDAPASAEGYDLYDMPTDQPGATGQGWADPSYQQAGQMPAEPTQEDLRQAVLGMSDDELLAHDIYFVALGASSKDHAGMKHFLADHRRDIRGAFLVNLDSVGAGDLVFLTHEGRTNTRRADRRMGRMLLNIAKDLHIPLGRVRHDWDDTDATLAMQSSVRATTLMGVGPGGVPALSATSEDVPQNVNPAQVVDVTDLIAELIRRS